VPAVDNDGLYEAGTCCHPSWQASEVAQIVRKHHCGDGPVLGLDGRRDSNAIIRDPTRYPSHVQDPARLAW